MGYKSRRRQNQEGDQNKEGNTIQEGGKNQV